MEKKRKRAESGMPVNKKPKFKKRAESEKSPYKVIIGRIDIYMMEWNALNMVVAACVICKKILSRLKSLICLSG